MLSHSKHAKPATPLQVAKYGHIAAALREAMAKRGWESAAKINEALGKPNGFASAYQWINAKGAPDTENAKKLARIFSIPVESLLKRETNGKTNLPTVQGVPVTPSRRLAEVLSFAVSSEGEARIRLDVVLPVDQAMPLLRILLDAGLVAAAPQ